MNPKAVFLGAQEIARLHEASLRMLSEVGVLIPDEEIMALLCAHGGEKKNGRVLLPAALVEKSIAQAGKSFHLYGRDGKRSVAFAQGAMVFCSSPGQFALFDGEKRREPRKADFLQAIHLAHHLPHIDVVGGLFLPAEYPPQRREVYMARELFARTDKPVFLWFSRKENFASVFAMSAVCAGSEEAARDEPRLFAFLEPNKPSAFSSRRPCHSQRGGGFRASGHDWAHGPGRVHRSCDPGGDPGPGECRNPCRCCDC